MFATAQMLNVFFVSVSLILSPMAIAQDGAADLASVALNVKADAQVLAGAAFDNIDIVKSENGELHHADMIQKDEEGEQTGYRFVPIRAQNGAVTHISVAIMDAEFKTVYSARRLALESPKGPAQMRLDLERDARTMAIEADQRMHESREEVGMIDRALQTIVPVAHAHSLMVLGLVMLGLGLTVILAAVGILNSSPQKNRRLKSIVGGALLAAGVVAMLHTVPAIHLGMTEAYDASVRRMESYRASFTGK